MIPARSIPALLALALITVSLGPVRLQAEGIHLPITARAEASVTWAENIARASSPANWIDTLRQEARFTATNLTPIATGLSLITGINAGYETVPRYVINTAYTAGASAQIRYKFGLGAYTPVLSAEGTFSRREARIDGATGWLATGALRLSQRFTPSWRASLTGDWSQHYAAHAPFDVRHHRLLGTVTYDLNSTWQLTYGRGSLWGDFTANAAGNIWARALSGGLGAPIQQYYNTVAYETTNSYAPGWVSYRVTGRSDFWWLELSPALGRNTSLPLRYESTFTVNRVGVKYRQDLWTAGILHRF
ncbi:MAG: hypothetical protein H7343_16540 [Undibacterium sp.]|nr:hypothetical protein [Opitutaceae bacterium]